MPSVQTAEKFMQIMQKFICLKPRLILPEHVIQFKKKMEALKGSSYSSEDHSFVFRILILLAQSETPLTMSELSTELNVPMSSATRIVDWLVRGDMVERVNDPSDRRVVRVGMSELGRQYYETGLAYNKKRLESLLKDFTEEEQSQMVGLMQKLLNSLESEVGK